MRFTVQPLTYDKTIAASGSFFDRKLYIAAAYNFDRSEVGLSSSYLVTDNVSLSANVYREANGNFTGIAGLSVYFVTGNPSHRRHLEKKVLPIEWLNE